MLLQELCEYFKDQSSANQDSLPPPMYEKVRIKWLIDLDQKGNFKGLNPTTDPSAPAEKKDRGKEFQAPHVQRTSGVKAKLLADTAPYVLGIPKEKQKPEHAAKCHESFVAEVKKCAESTKNDQMPAVLKFLVSLENLTPEQIKSKLQLPGDFVPDDVMTFRIDGVLPIDLDEIKKYWAKSKATEKASVHSMSCIVCGETCNPQKRIEFKIKGIPGGQTSGVAIISANQKAFESYGLEESLIAPTCQNCSEKFSKALNELIKDESSHLKIGSLVYVFWTKHKSEFNYKRLLDDPQPEEVKSLLESTRKGKMPTELPSNQFYATALSASGGRLVVRDWLDTTVDEAQRSLSHYFALQKIAGDDEHPLKLAALAGATVREFKDLNPNTPKVLIRTAFHQSPLPKWLLYKVIQRIKAEHGVKRPQAALIKMVLLSNQPNQKQEKEGYMVTLEKENKDPAYLCGRLFAVLEDIQRKAIPGAGSTITDRFFGTASSAPASVFGSLLRHAQNHLGKLRKEKQAAYFALEKRMEEILSGLPAFPKTLSLEKQGLFNLGYYHQRAATREAIAKKQEKENEE